ncbi:MAG: cytochrome b/b6 domain-containing protein [Acidimicrobiales bacterium]|jgi:formate dehydrogenase subunit gamma
MTSQIRDEPRATVRILRFDLTQRCAHWANALLFGILMATALPLYFGSLAGIVGRRHLIAEIHLWAGIALPLPIVIALIGPWGARMRRDVRRFNLWTRDEIRWLRNLGTTPIVPDKFNPGQKLNAIFVGAAIVVMLATGSIMQWFGHFPVSWRTGATFVHDVFALAVFVVVFGHIAIAVTHPGSMRSMIKGWVTETWAARHAAGWLEEEKGQEESDSSR